MDLVTRWNSVFEAGLLPGITLKTPGVGEMVPAFLEYYQQIWWDCRSDLPQLAHTYSPAEQAVNGKQLERMLSGLISELKYLPQSEAERTAWQLRMRPPLCQFALDVFRLQPYHLDYVEASGLVAAFQRFAQMARHFDPQISADDIYQAGRNVMTANFIQLLLGLPVRVTPSIFAYSMLYPYSDNYLDDPAIPTSTKLAFNRRFRQRLLGETVAAANSYETTINTLIGMIESEWDRSEYPQVYESLLAIHSAQTHSLKLADSNGSPFERDILGISFEKGGTSVLADGYLAAGNLTPDQARILFGFGTFTQLMDDLEDLRPDMVEKRASLFSMTAPFWKLDGLNNRFFNYGHKVIGDLNAFTSPDVPLLAELMAACVDPMLLNSVGQLPEFFGKPCLAQLESHMPFRFDVIQKQRQRLARHRLNLSRMMETFLM